MTWGTAEMYIEDANVLLILNKWKEKMFCGPLTRRGQILRARQHDILASTLANCVGFWDRLPSR